MNKKGFTGLELLGARSAEAMRLIKPDKKWTPNQNNPACSVRNANLFKEQWDNCLVQLEKEMRD